MNDRSIMEDEIVSVPVPKRLLPVVIQALAKALEPADTIPATTVETEKESTKATKPEHNASISIDWTQASNMKILREGLKSAIALKLLDMTAARPGEKVPFKEIYTAAGYTETRRAGSSLGSLTKVIKRDFGVPFEKSVWPVEHHWAVNDDAQYYYCMQPEEAQAWHTSAA